MKPGIIKDAADVEFMRLTLKAVAPSYPGFLVPEMALNIDTLCDLAQIGLELKNSSLKGHR